MKHTMEFNVYDNDDELTEVIISIRERKHINFSIGGKTYGIKKKDLMEMIEFINSVKIE